MSDGPLEAYRKAGGERPDALFLENLFDAINSSYSSPFSRLIASEICFDLAVAQPAHSDQWLKEADGKLLGVIAAVQTLRNRGAALFVRSAQAFTLAHLRLAESANWQAATRDHQIRSDYNASLQAAHKAQTFARATQDACSSLQEFVPILLGDRKNDQTPRKGWSGRLSLFRENGGDRTSAGRNPNWDIGICRGVGAIRFIDPILRLQVKNNFEGKDRGHHPNDYRNAGVIPIDAEKIGFGDPVQVVWSCLAEQEAPPAHMIEGIELLSSEQLDQITLRLEEEFSSARQPSGPAS